jgi:multiple sugar transport system ATP-binding protein
VHEPLGSDVILYLTTGPHSIVARVEARSQAKMGQNIEVVMGMRKMHLFNPDTQQAII